MVVVSKKLLHHIPGSELHFYHFSSILNIVRILKV